MRRKVYIIGIDGATFRVIDPLVAQGRLPTFKRLMDNGVRGILRSTVPANSAAAWSSFMTGKNPGKHGVFGFMSMSADHHRFVLTNGGHVRSRTLWEVLSQAERRVAVINVPLTYPPRRVNGLMVCGMDASFLKNFTFPPQFSEELLTACPGYTIDFPFVENQAFQERLLAQVTRLIEVRKNAMLLLLDKTDPDLFVGVFTCTDRLQHHLWHSIDSTHPKHHSRKPDHAAVIERMYEQIDDAVNQIIGRMDEHTTLLVISDHGFSGVAQRFLVNRWLIRAGWLRLRPGGRVSAQANLMRTLKRHPALYEFVRKVKRVAPGLKNVPVRAGTMSRSFFERVDWAGSRAFYFPPGIRLNLQGREADGVVPASEYEVTRETLIGQLSGMTDGHDGVPVFARLARREDVYSGPYVDQAPDIILEPHSNNDDAHRNFSLGRRLRGREDDEPFVCDAPPGDHSPEGVLLGSGKNLKSGSIIQGATLTDITPTVLWHLGVPVPSDMDGRVLSEMFAARVRDEYPQIVVSEEEAPSGPLWQYDEEEEAVIRERLRDLGYLS